MTRLAGAALSVVAAGLAACAPGPRSGAGLRLPDGDVERGRAVFVEMRCHSCHRVEGLDLPEPVADPPVPIELGGERHYPRTDGELLTAIVNPSHRIVPSGRRESVTQGRLSRMGDFGENMTVSELVDVVAFLQSRYRVVPAEIHYR